MPFPVGHKQKKEDCFRCCLAYMLDWSPRSVPFYEPQGPGKDSKFWDDYKLWVSERLGLTLACFGKEAVDVFSEYDRNWIASVPSNCNDGIEHAVVMKGAKLEYDPSHTRVQRPKKFLNATVLADNYKSHNDGTCTFIY